jgi:SAM-dependent methyltransferase
MPEPDAGALLDSALRMWPDRPGKAVFRTLDALMLHRVPLRPPVLDLGCGNGEFATLTGAAMAVGIDRSVMASRAAAASGRYGHVVAADLHALPFRARLFAGAHCNSTLEHVEHPDAVLREAARVLRPGGILALTVPTPRKREWLYYGDYAETVGAATLAERYRASFDERWEHRHYFRGTDLVAVVEAAGFAVEQSRPVSQAIEVLNLVRLGWPAEAAEPVAGLVRDGTRQALHRYLRPLLADPHATHGASLLCVAARAPD